MAVATQTPGFIFSTDGKSAPSYADLMKRRKVFDALMAQQAGARAPQNVGEGIYALGQGIVNGLEGRALRKQEEALGERQKELWSDLSAIGMASGGAGAGYGSATGPISDGRYTAADLGNTSTDPLSTKPADGDIYTSFLDTVRTGDPEKGLSGITNPYGLAAVAATGKHESGYSARNAFGDWADPSESGQAGQAGGVLSWRAERLASMRDFVAKNGGDPRRPDPRLQAQFFLAEDPGLVARLNAAKTPEEAQSLMNGAWRFAGYDRPGGEAARRIATARSYVSQFAGEPQPQAEQAPVQVASLDPSAGVAEATRAGASVSTAPTVGGQQPVPANVPVPTAREALEKAFAVQAEKDGMSSIAPLELPGATPQTEEAIQRYAAANGTSPMQYQAGQTGPGTVSAPGSVADQQADALIAGDPERPIVAPAPTPRPHDFSAAAYNADVDAMAAGIPPQAVAASAMAQQPAPFDPVNGTAMGGNSGAADAARAAYQQANGGSPKVQMVAEAMARSGATAAPPKPADPVRAEAVQRVATAQNQAQAQGRFGQLMQIMMNPSASPEQKQVAGMYLEQDQQFRNQQQNREWEMLKLRESRAYEDHKAERDRINGNADYMTRKRIDQQYERPQIIDVFDETTGRSRKGYMGQDGRFVPVGGVEASKGYRDLTPEEVAQRGLPPGAYQAGPDGRIEGVGKGGITINTGENGSEFTKEGEKSANTRLNEIIAGGQSASTMLGDVQQLADLGRQIGTGKIAEVKAALGPYAEAFGIDISKQGEAEAYKAIIARMAPNMRPAGSGATSDFDANQFLQSLPRLGNSPEGNQIITDTFTALSQNKMQAAEIAAQAYLPKDQGGITWQEAEKQIRRLPNPYERFKAMRGQLPQPAATSAPAEAPVTMPSQMPAQTAPQAPARAEPTRQRWDRGAPVRQPSAPVPKRATNPQTGQVIELRNGQWVPVQ